MAPLKELEDLVPQMMDIDGINGASTFFRRIHLISFHSFARPEFINGTVERKAYPSAALGANRNGGLHHQKMVEPESDGFGEWDLITKSPQKKATRAGMNML
jgi:hypothetical protein